MKILQLFINYKYSYIVLFISSFICIFLEGFGYATIWPIVNSVLDTDVNETNKLYLIFFYLFESVGLEFNAINLSILFFFLILLKNILKIVNHYLTDNTIHRSRMNWIEKMINNYNQMPYIQFINKKRGTLYNNLTVETMHSSNAVKNFTEIFTASASILIFFTIFIINSFKITIIVLIIGIIIFLINKILLSKYSKDTGEREVALHQNLSNLINDYLASYKNIIVFDAFNEIKNIIVEKLSNLRSILVKWAVYTFLPIPVIEIIIVFVFVIFIILLSIDNNSQSILYSFPDLALAVVLSHRLLQQLTRLIVSYNSFNRVKPSLLTVHHEIFYNQKNIYQKNNIIEKDTISDVQGYMKIVNLSFGYEDLKIFDKINIDIPINQITSIIGESGSGKTTLGEIILGLIEPDTGYVELNNKDIKSFSNYYDKILYVSQDNILIDSSLKENLKFFCKDIDNVHFDYIVKELQINKIFDKFSDNLDRKIKNFGENLSGGQKQRLCVARALIRKPEIIILDEVTSALDNDNEKIILNAISKIMKNKTIIFISHKKSIIDYSDNVFKIENKKIKKIK